MNNTRKTRHTSSPTPEWQRYWAEMEFGCRQILHYTQSMNEVTFYQNKMAFEAVLYNLERIYEAAQRLPEDMHFWLKEEDWRTLDNFKGVTTKTRFELDPKELWAIIDEQLPGLLTALRSARKENASSKRHSRRGRNAARPWQLPRLGWRDISWRVWAQFSKNNISMVAAGVAFYGLLAIFPTLAALVSIYGLLLNPADVESQLAFLKDIYPKEAWAILQNQLHTLASQSGTALSISAFIGILLALWSARAGTGALMTALNIVYNEEEKRSLIRFNLTALLLTLGGILFGVAALSLIVVLPTLVGHINTGLGTMTEAALIWLRWPLLAVVIMVALTILYRFGPSRRAARWEWLSIGAVVATLLWIVISILFSFYVAHFGSYNKTYGSLGAVVILMLWFWLTALAVLIGGEFNAEMEHQTKKDTTIGKPKPMGERDAYMADTLGRRP